MNEDKQQIDDFDATIDTLQNYVINDPEQPLFEDVEKQRKLHKEAWNVVHNAMMVKRDNN